MLKPHILYHNKKYKKLLVSTCMFVLFFWASMLNLKIELIVLINSESYVSGTANKIKSISLVHILYF